MWNHCTMRSQLTLPLLITKKLLLYCYLGHNYACLKKNIYSIDVYTENIIPPFPNDFLQIVFCYLAMLIFPTPLVDFQRHN